MSFAHISESRLNSHLPEGASNAVVDDLGALSDRLLLELTARSCVGRLPVVDPPFRDLDAFPGMSKHLELAGLAL